MKLTDLQVDALNEAADVVNDAKAALKTAQAERERLVRELAAEGYSYRSIARASGLSYQRVAQLTGGRDDRLDIMATGEAWCPRCDAAPGAPCVGASGQFHIERHYRRAAIHDGEIDEIVEGEPAYVPNL